MAPALPYERPEGSMSCPYLKEVVMLFCSGYPVRKMVPLDRIVSASPCLTHDFEHCPLYRELLARIDQCACGDAPVAGKAEPTPCFKEVRR
jgi:hypothetical protein